MLGHVTQLLLIMATTLPFVGGGVYIRSIVRGKSRPQRTTYGLFLCISIVAAMALFGSTAFWLVFVSFMQAAVIFALSLRFGVPGRKKLDAICIGVCIFGLLAWQCSNNVLLALVGSVIADFAAVIPALVKTWRQPATEAWAFYALDSVAAGLFAAIGPYSVVNTIYPLYLCAINAVFVVVILRTYLGKCWCRVAFSRSRYNSE